MVEILLSTGKTLAELDHDRTADLTFDFRCFFLNRSRQELYNRIGLRCEHMVVNGILQVCQQSISTYHPSRDQGETDLQEANLVGIPSNSSACADSMHPS